MIYNFNQLEVLCRRVIRANTSSPLRNMCKLTEETGELAAEVFNDCPDRQAMIDEIADVVICAVCQGEFIGMRAGELTEALLRKGLKGIKNGSRANDNH